LYYFEKINIYACKFFTDSLIIFIIISCCKNCNKKKSCCKITTWNGCTKIYI